MRIFGIVKYFFIFLEKNIRHVGKATTETTMAFGDH